MTKRTKEPGGNKSYQITLDSYLTGGKPQLAWGDLHPLYRGNIIKCYGCGGWLRREKGGRELICETCREELLENGLTNLSEADKALFSQLLKRFDIEVVPLAH